MSREQVFWGWGEPGAGPSLPAHAAVFLRERLGVSGEVVSSPVALDAVRLRPGALGDALRAALAGAVGEAGVREDAEARVLRCRGKSYTDLLAQRAGDCLTAPDAVVRPRTHEQVARVLRACSEAGAAVVPFGGGTSVVGGLEASREDLEAVVSLDLGAMDAVVGVDAEALTAVLEPGLRLPEADRALATRGLTLAHVPQSYEWASVGGCVATRSAGQSSTGHGRIDEHVLGLRCATPAGDLAAAAVPATAAGPSLRGLVVGSEGVLGAITQVALRVRRRPAARRYEGWFLRSFEAGCEALRVLAQDGPLPDVARLSDETETRVSLALAGPGGPGRRAGMGALRALGYGDGCLLVLGWEDASDAAIAARRRGVRARLRGAGAVPAGRGPGDAWAAARFAGPHLRDDLLDRGVLVETLETATGWRAVTALRTAVARALEGALPGAEVGCHVSHLYATGASLYFTVLAAQAADPAAQWRAAKAAASDAIVASGATITHHHAIGRDHAPWLGAETGALGLELLRAVKERCDPAGVMNPGVLL